MVVKENTLFTAILREIWSDRIAKKGYVECLDEFNNVKLRLQPGDKEKKQIDRNFDKNRIKDLYEKFDSKYKDIVSKNIAPVEKIE